MTDTMNTPDRTGTMGQRQEPVVAAQDALSNDERKAAKKGDTQWSQVGGEGPAAPKQPNEHDESADSQAGDGMQADPMAQAAYADAVGPQEDTSRGEVTDRIYNEAVVEGHRVGDDEQATGERDPAKSTSSAKR